MTYFSLSQSTCPFDWFVAHAFPPVFSQVADAMRRMHERQNIGKIILLPEPKKEEEPPKPESSEKKEKNKADVKDKKEEAAEEVKEDWVRRIPLEALKI